MGRKKLDANAYDKLVAAYRLHGEHPFTVAKAVGVDYATAKKAWFLGWPALGWDPIKALFEREKFGARAQAVQDVQARESATLHEREIAYDHAVKSRAMEGKSVETMRILAHFNLQSMVKLSEAIRKLLEFAKASIESEIAGLDMTSAQAIAKARKLLEMQECVFALQHQAMVDERLHFGEPSQVIEVIQRQETLTKAELTVRLQNVQHALEEAIEVGGVTGPALGMVRPVIGKVVSG